jgi:hypothetical protein
LFFARRRVKTLDGRRREEDEQIEEVEGGVARVVAKMFTVFYVGQEASSSDNKL